ncbi:MAG TPA: TMEM143 family protein, partial [Hyphomicrobium sp.]|nr:TMEM143 family protein [Hyphomicrobium sp.]
DSDLLITRQYTPDEKKRLQKRAVSEIKRILERANYVAIDPKSVEVILTKDSHYGLDLHVDMGVFEECLLYYRGASKKRDTRTNYRKFLRKEEFDVPIYRRLVLLFKLKPFAVRVKEVMAEKNISEKEAAKIVTRMRGSLPTEVKEDNIYIKLFKNIPRNDLEMVFPNTRVRFRLLDKIKLGVTGGGAVGMGLVGTAGKLAAGGLTVANPIALLGAVAGLGGIAFRQGVNFMNQKQRYMVVMAQNLYFHAMADNRGVMIKLSERGAEEDVKEEILLYSVLAKETAKRSDLKLIDAAVEKYLRTTFDIQVDFDLPDALDRLIADGIVREDADGTLHTLPPIEAARHLDAKWDRYLDDLPDGATQEGLELDAEEVPLL